MANLKIVSFPTESPISGENVINRLEEALEFAKQGTICNCMIVMAGNDNSVVDCWANGNKPFVMIGGLESVKREFMDAIIEKR